MNKCDYYKSGERFECHTYNGRPLGMMVPYNYCNGTKERDECTCNGDKTKCNFYPEIRKKAIREVKGIRTNADMIRHMNDEELANFFNERVNVGACSDFGIAHNRECDSNCLECIKEWLQALANID